MLEGLSFPTAPVWQIPACEGAWAPGARRASPLSARPTMAVPPVKGLDEACVWLRKAALTPFPPVTKFEQDYGHGTRLGRELKCLLLTIAFSNRYFSLCCILGATVSHHTVSGADVQRKHAFVPRWPSNCSPR